MSREIVAADGWRRGEDEADPIVITGNEKNEASAMPPCRFNTSSSEQQSEINRQMENCAGYHLAGFFKRRPSAAFPHDLILNSRTVSLSRLQRGPHPLCDIAQSKKGLSTATIQSAADDVSSIAPLCLH